LDTSSNWNWNPLEEYKPQEPQHICHILTSRQRAMLFRWPGQCLLNRHTSSRIGSGRNGTDLSGME